MTTRQKRRRKDPKGPEALRPHTAFWQRGVSSAHDHRIRTHYGIITLGTGIPNRIRSHREEGRRTRGLTTRTTPAPTRLGGRTPTLGYPNAAAAHRRPARLQCRYPRLSATSS